MFARKGSMVQGFISRCGLLSLISALTWAMASDSFGQTGSVITVSITVYLPIDPSSAYCSNAAQPIPESGRASISDNYGSNGVTTTVPSGVGLHHLVSLSSMNDYYQAHLMLTTASFVFYALAKKYSSLPSPYCVAPYTITFNNIPYLVGTKPSFTAAGTNIYSLLANTTNPDNTANTNFQCTSTLSSQTCTIVIPLDLTTSKATAINRLYTDAETLLALSQKVYCEGTANTNTCN